MEEDESEQTAQELIDTSEETTAQDVVDDSVKHTREDLSQENEDFEGNIKDEDIEEKAEQNVEDLKDLNENNRIVTQRARDEDRVQSNLRQQSIELRDKVHNKIEQLQGVRSEDFKGEAEKLREQKVQENYDTIGETRLNMLRNEKKDIIKERNLNLTLGREKRAQQKYDKLRNERIFGSPSPGAVAGARVGAFFGFSRTGIVGEKALKQSLNNQKRILGDYDNIIDAKRGERNRKFAEYKKDGRISQAEEADMKKLMKQISGFQQSRDKQANKVRALRAEQITDSKFNYMPKADVNKMKQNNFTHDFSFLKKAGGLKKGRKGRKGKKTTKASYNKILKNQLAITNKPIPNLAQYRPDLQPKLQPQLQPENLQDIPEIKQVPQKPRNDFGVADWIVDM